MKVGILVIAHDELGNVMLETVKGTLGYLPLTALSLAVSRDQDPDLLRQQASELCDQANSGDGVLVLTDMYGSTPSNVACSLQGLPDIRVISGINLPMLIRVFNYADLELEALANKAVSGGQDGVMICDQLCATGITHGQS